MRSELFQMREDHRLFSTAEEESQFRSNADDISECDEGPNAILNSCLRKAGVRSRLLLANERKTLHY